MTTNNAINLTSQGMAYYNGSGLFSAPALTNFGVTYGTSVNDIASTAAGTTGTVLIGNTGIAPSFSSTVSSLTINTLTSTTATITNLTVTNFTPTTPITVPFGGTGSSSFTPWGVIYEGATSTSPLLSVDLSAGQVLIGTSTAPVAAFLTAGTGISITTAQGSITITNSEASGGGFTWNDRSSSFTAVAGNGYFVTGTTTATLPTTPSLGDSVVIQDIDPSLFVTVITGNANLIRIGTTVSTATTGSVKNTAQGDSITLTYNAADTTWHARAVQGNWTVS